MYRYTDCACVFHLGTVFRVVTHMHRNIRCDKNLDAYINIRSLNWTDCEYIYSCSSWGGLLVGCKMINSNEHTESWWLNALLLCLLRAQGDTEEQLPEEDAQVRCVWCACVCRVCECEWGVVCVRVHVWCVCMRVCVCAHMHMCTPCTYMRTYIRTCMYNIMCILCVLYYTHMCACCVGRFKHLCWSVCCEVPKWLTHSPFRPHSIRKDRDCTLGRGALNYY